MIAVWMVYAMVLSAIAAAIAFLMDRIAGLLRLPRRWAWFGGLCASLVAPVVAWGAARWRPAPLEVVGTESISPVMEVTTTGPVVGAWVRQLAGWSVLDGPLLTLWAAATLIMLGALTATTVRLHREARRWTRSEVDGVPVLVAPDVGPAVVGTFPTSIVLPAWLLIQDDPERSTVVRHEREHQRVGDTRLVQTALVMLAAAPWMAPMWWMFTRLREAIEFDCDLRVLNAGTEPTSYARLLIDLTNRSGRYLGPATTLADRPSILSRRIETMFAPKPRFIAPRAAALVAVAGLFVIAACETPTPPVEAPDVQFDQPAKTEPVRVEGLAPVYPDHLRDAGIEGHVVLRMDVLEDGSVDQATVEVLESTDPAFEAPAIDGLQRAVFDLANGGEPVAATIEHTVHFRLDDLPFGDVSGEADASAPEGGKVELRFGVPVGEGAQTPDGEPLVFIDGEPATQAQVAELSKDQIERVEVIKGGAARAMFGETASNGVIQIYLKIR